MKNKSAYILLIFLPIIFYNLNKSKATSPDIVFESNPFSITEDTTIYERVEQMPSFPGGEAEMQKFICNNLKYPLIPDDNSMENFSTSVRFVVTKTGEIKDIVPTRDKYKGRILTDTLTQIIKRMPRWNPAIHEGKKVNVYFTLPLYISPALN